MPAGCLRVEGCAPSPAPASWPGTRLPTRRCQSFVSPAVRGIAHILESQCPYAFTIQRHNRERFRESGRQMLKCSLACSAQCVAHILKILERHYPSTFTIQNHYSDDFSEVCLQSLDASLCLGRAKLWKHKPSRPHASPYARLHTAPARDRGVASQASHWCLSAQGVQT